MDFHDSAAVKDIVPAAAHADTFGLITRLKLASFVCVTRSSETQLPGMF